MTNEEWKEFVSIVRNNSVEENNELLWNIQICKFYYLDSGKIKHLTDQESLGLSRFLIERVMYPIGNREQISCNCGSRHGYVVEFEDHERVYQHTVCMICDTVQMFSQFEKIVKEEEEECFVPTSGTWLSRLRQRLLPQVV